MNLKNLKDKELHLAIKNLVEKERELLTQILRHLYEIERRRLFCDYQCSSLWEYCVKQLGYSEGQAMRRIAAMRLIKEMPQVEEKISAGELSLSNAASVYRFFKNENKVNPEAISKEMKINILEQLENKSARECEKTLFSLSSQPAIHSERTKVVSETLTEIHVLADDELMKKLGIVKGLLAHQEPNASYGALLKKLCDIAIEKLSPPKPKRNSKEKDVSATTQGPTTSHEASSQATPLLEKNRSVATVEYQKYQNSFQRKALSKAIKYEVFKRDKGKCVDCGSQHALEYDHKTCLSLGGSNDINNIQLRCKKCNQRAAIKQLGLKKMDPYLNGTKEK